MWPGKVASPRIQPLKQLWEFQQGRHRPLAAGNAARPAVQTFPGPASPPGERAPGVAPGQGAAEALRAADRPAPALPCPCRGRFGKADPSGARRFLGANAARPGVRAPELRPVLPAPGREPTAGRARRGRRWTDRGGDAGTWRAGGAGAARCEDSDPGAAPGEGAK